MAVGAVVLAASLVARLVWLDGAFDVTEPDELMYVHVAENFAAGVPYPRYDYETRYRDGLFVVPPFPLYTAGLVFRAFGASLYSFRALNVCWGVAGVAAFGLLAALYLEGLPLLVATMVFAFSPVALRESTQALLGAPAVCFLLVSLWAYVRHVREGRGRYLVVFALALGATAACKQYGVLLGAVLAVHGLWVRWRRGGPSLRRLAAGFGLAVATFGLLVPWVFWRPRDALDLYLYQSLIAHVTGLLRGAESGPTLFAVPYPGLVAGHALVGLMGLAVFAATWRRRADAVLFYGVLLGVPILAMRQARHLSLGLPAWCLFAGYLLAAGAEWGRRSRPARVGTGLLAVLLVGSVGPAAMVPWRRPSGLAGACRFVAGHTLPGEQVLSNYWRPVIERLTGRRVPRDWLDAEARRLIARGEVAAVILDRSVYTRRVLHTPERAATAAWVRETFPVVWACRPAHGGSATVYLTRGGEGKRAVGGGEGEAPTESPIR